MSALYKVTHEEGFLVSLGTAPFFSLDRAGRVLNNMGQVAAAVHQYDRFPDLLNHVAAQYPWSAEKRRFVTRLSHPNHR